MAVVVVEAAFVGVAVADSHGDDGKSKKQKNFEAKESEIIQKSAGHQTAKPKFWGE